MPRYDYHCPNPDCWQDWSIVKPMKDFKEEELCPNCRHILERDFNSCGIHCGNKSYGNTPVISESLGIHPEQAAEHRKNHPNVEVMPMGQLKFSDYQSHDKYLKKIGWNKPCVKKEI